MFNIVSKARAFAEKLAPQATELDHDPELLKQVFERYCEEGLHIYGGPRSELSINEWGEWLAVLSEASGAFAFLAMQQLVANGFITWQGTDWPKIGVAFGHLRNPSVLVPREKNGMVTGFIPWLTGSHAFDLVVFGYQDPDYREAYAILPVTDRSEFQHGEPMDLIAGTSTQTVSITVDQLQIEDGMLFRIGPPGERSEKDADAALLHTPLMVGNMRASLNLLQESHRIDPSLRERVIKQTEALIDELSKAMREGVTRQKAHALRARVTLRMSRLAHLACLASGGEGLLASHPAQRVYREALLFGSLAQTDQIVDSIAEAALA